MVILATDGDGFDGWPQLDRRTRRGDNFPSVTRETSNADAASHISARALRSGARGLTGL